MTGFHMYTNKQASVTRMGKVIATLNAELEQVRAQWQTDKNANAALHEECSALRTESERLCRAHVVAKIEQEANTACQDKCVAQVLRLEEALAKLHEEVDSVRAKHNLEIVRLRQLQNDASDRCDDLTRKCDVLQQKCIMFQVRSVPFQSLCTHVTFFSSAGQSRVWPCLFFYSRVSARRLSN